MIDISSGACQTVETSRCSIHVCIINEYSHNLKTISEYIIESDIEKISVFIFIDGVDVECGDAGYYEIGEPC